MRLKYLFPFWIDMAVPVFMIISGYVYALSYKKMELTRWGEAYLLKNVISKMIRYTIPFVIAYAVEILWLVFNDRLSFPLDGTLNLGQAFLAGGLGPGSYYYPLMMQFIFVYPLIYFVIRKYQVKGVVIWGCINALFELLKWAYLMSAETYRLLLFRYLLLIAVGCYVANDNFIVTKRASITVTIIGVFFIYCCSYLQYTFPIITYWTCTSFIACFYIIPLSMFSIEKLKNIRFKLIEIIGKASYHIFLVQMVWYYLAYERIDCWNIYWALVINLVMCVGVGIIFYWIETPINELINKKIFYLIKLAQE